MKRRLVYQQLRDKIYAHIKSNGLQKGDHLPSICALAEEWNTNYGTMKTAYKLLESEGVLTYKGRRGAVINAGLEAPKKTGLCWIRWQGDAFCFELSRGIRRYTEEQNLELIVIDAMRSHELFFGHGHVSGGPCWRPADTA